ncbi:MAG: low molecular weight protein-tyrosine-phosphatase [Cyanobacteriota bacterium]|nr:low molecular weight protein-tyrosine-phosphatase [Cyanobacteriota bacterium]
MRPTRLLFVCLGNICRSPAAEGVFLHRVSQEGLSDHFEVDSAGTGGWHVGKPADQRMRAAAERRGIGLASRARQICLDDFNLFDHILTMDGDNLRVVQALERKVHSPRARVEPLVRYCRRWQAHEVPDPYYGGSEGFERVLDVLDDACSGLLESLRPG